MLLLALGGSIFAIIRWKLHPRVSLMTLIALAIYVIEAFLFSILLYYIPDLTQSLHVSYKAIDWLYFFVFFFEDFVPALIILLLVGAAFSQRNTPLATRNA
jgi:hypothetical protein